MQRACKQIMVIDDLADRRHHSNILLDQNYGSSTMRYADLLPAECKQLHGPHFALLKPAYAKRRSEHRIRSNKIKRVLIYFGGTDHANLTAMALSAFQAPDLIDIDLDIVVGANYYHGHGLETVATARGRTCIYNQLSDLSDLMNNADLAIGAGGATTWERCCLGLPSIIISTGDNQIPGCVALAEDGLIMYLGDSSTIDCGRLLVVIRGLICAPEQLETYGHLCRNLVDGCGVNRVIECLNEGDVRGVR